MLDDFTPEERATLARLERSDAFVYRQAEQFSLVIAGYYICDLDTEICKSLIEKKAMFELGENTQPKGDGTEWVYAADPRMFAPQFVIDNGTD